MLSLLKTSPNNIEAFAIIHKLTVNLKQKPHGCGLCTALVANLWILYSTLYSKIDVMYLYTEGGKDVLGGISDTQMQTTLATALATANEAMNNSDIGLSLSLTHVGLVRKLHRAGRGLVRKGKNSQLLRSLVCRQHNLVRSCFLQGQRATTLRQVCHPADSHAHEGGPFVTSRGLNASPTVRSHPVSPTRYQGFVNSTTTFKSIIYLTSGTTVTLYYSIL